MAGSPSTTGHRFIYFQFALAPAVRANPTSELKVTAYRQMRRSLVMRFTFLSRGGDPLRCDSNDVCGVLPARRSAQRPCVPDRNEVKHADRYAAPPQAP